MAAFQKTALPQFSLLSVTSRGMEYALGQFGSAVLVASPHNFLHIPNLLAEGAEWEKEKALMLCKHCSAIAKPLVCYQCCFSYKSKT